MGKVKEIVSKVKNALSETAGFDMSKKEYRERQAMNDYHLAKNKRSAQVTKWQRLDEYYNNKHYTRAQVEELIEKNNWSFTPPVLPDPFIQVESQIDSVIPQVEFRGRDGDIDSQKAKERQSVVDFICYNNKIKQLNTENERTLNKLGNAFWKVAFDGSIKGFGYVGDITIGNPNPSYIFPDPAAYDVEDCEFIIYSYRIHRRKARRIYGPIIDECGENAFFKDTEIFDREENTLTMLDNTMQVVEYWYRDEEGDIACSIQVDNTEVKWIPKYWINTKASGNQRYPFIKYCKIPVDQSFWDKGEIETIVDLVDAADREFISALLVDMMQPSDVIVYEPNSLYEGQQIETGPNASIKMKDNRVNAIRRLGGLGSNVNALNTIEFIHKKIEETTGNSATNNGLEPTKVTTASGIAMINDRADARKNVKKADRLSGFERLYELIDWTALEFYNTDRVIMIRGANDTNEESFNESKIFNSDNFKMLDELKSKELQIKGMEAGKSVEEIDQIIQQNAYYFPPVDVEIVAGDGINKSRAFTLQAITELAKTPITPVNKEIIKAQIDLLDLPNKKEIKEAIDQAIQSQQQPQQQVPPQQGQLQQQQQAPTGISNADIQNIEEDKKLTPDELDLFLQATPEQQDMILNDLGISPDTVTAQLLQMQGGDVQ